MKAPALFSSVALLAALAITACGSKQGSSPKAPGQNAEGAPAGGEALATAPRAPSKAVVVAVATLASPMAQLGKLAQFADAVKPGAGAMLNGAALGGMIGAMMGLSSLDGADLSKPLHLVVLDPKVEPRPLVLAVTVADAKRLDQAVKGGPGLVMVENGGLAFIGSEAALTPAVAYHETVAGRPLPPLPTLTLLVSSLPPSYAEDIAKLKKELPAQLGASASGPGADVVLEAEMDFLGKLAAQTDRLEIALDAGGHGIDVDFVLIAKNGSLVSQFYAAQKTSDYALLSRLPAGQGMFVVAGHIESGPLRDSIVQFTTRLMAGISQKPPDAAATAAVKECFEVMTGDVAAWGTIRAGKGMEAAEIAGVTDAARAVKVMETFAKSFGSMTFMNQKMTLKYEPKALKYDGLTVSSQKTTVTPAPGAAAPPVAMPPTTTHLAAFDGLLAMTIGDGNPKGIKALIDSARKKKKTFAPSGGLTAALAASRSRKESIFMFFDVASIMENAAAMAATASPAGPKAAPKAAGKPAAVAGPARTSGATVGLAFEPTSARIHVAVPVDHIKEIEAVQSQSARAANP